MAGSPFTQTIIKKMTIKNTIPSLIEEHARNFPQHKAIVCGKKTLNYYELNQKANQLAHYLQSIGITPDMSIALCIERSVDFLITILAILKAGAAYLPLDSTQPIERLSFLLHDSKSSILITKSALQSKFSSYQGQLVLLDKSQKIIKQQPVEHLNTLLNEKHLAYVIYTSGSTGTPKGVLIEHGSVINYSNWFAEYSVTQYQQHIDFSANPIFDMAISVSIVPLMLGLTIVICDEEVKKHPNKYLQYLANTHIQTIKLTPSYFKILLQEAKLHFVALPDLKSIILGGENLSVTECKAWLELYPEQEFSKMK